jgi:DNA-binding transcriptional regulator GbsR (MarR family)
MTGQGRSEKRRSRNATKPAKSSVESASAIKQRLYSSFANVAALMGYSEVHGRIIAALTAGGEPMALARLAKETGYSLSSISTSLDLLEVLGMVRKVKVPGDRRVYVQLEGDLLEGLKRAVVMKGKKGVTNAFTEFTQFEAALDSLPDDEDRAKVANILAKLRGELELLEAYLDLLGGIQLPRDPAATR